VDKVHNAQIFSKVDVQQGYNNIQVKEGNKHKTAFKMNMGLYKNTVMPFSLKNAPAVFQQFMNTEFIDLTATGKVIIYMDDILIATLDNITEHQKLVHQVLERLRKLDLYLKPSKCVFETRKIEFLGVILENSTVTMDPVKITGVEEWKTPKNVKDICEFLRFCNFY
jgi:hypothetical protein